MARPSIVRYLSHPQVQIDSDVPVPDWPLNDLGQARIAALAKDAADRFAGTTSVFTSPERKARDAAMPLAKALNLPLTVAHDSHENDRSSTGFLPPQAFEAAADAFFGAPEKSFKGWERAIDAQKRIQTSVRSMLEQAPPGDVLIVGHGAVGTLLICALLREPITRVYDQGPGGGGNFFTFERKSSQLLTHWRSF